MDNFYKTCPPKMADARHMTDYRPHTQLEEQIKYVNGITRDDEARMFLQNNADKIVDREWEFLKNNRSCWVNECVHKYPIRMTPPWFSEELNNYNLRMTPNHVPFTCPKFDDYRLTATPATAPVAEKSPAK